MLKLTVYCGKDGNFDEHKLYSDMAYAVNDGDLVCTASDGRRFLYAKGYWSLCVVEEIDDA